MCDRAGERAQDEHQAGRVDQEKNAVGVHPRELAHQRREPLIRPEFRRGRQPHAGQQQEEQRPKYLAEHLARGNAGRDAFGLGILERQHADQIEERRHHDEPELDAPAAQPRFRHPRPGPGFRQAVGQQAADDHSTGPPGVEHVELVDLVVAIDRRNQRIDHAFDDALRQTHQQESDEEHDRALMRPNRRYRRFERRGSNQDERHTGQVCDGRQRVQNAHSKQINEEAAEKYRNREPGERRPPQQAHLLLADLKGGGHVAFHRAADGEDHRRRDQRHATDDEQARAIHLSGSPGRGTRGDVAGRSISTKTAARHRTWEIQRAWNRV